MTLIELVLRFLALFTVLFSHAQADQLRQIQPNQAIHYLGQKVTVCGEVVSTKYSNKSRGKPTFLNLDKPYPYHVFTAVIWESYRSQFSVAPERYYLKKHICVSGVVSSYKNKAQIEVKSLDQISESY